jgi:hypothetical protein
MVESEVKRFVVKDGRQRSMIKRAKDAKHTVGDVLTVLQKGNSQSLTNLRTRVLKRRRG